MGSGGSTPDDARVTDQENLPGRRNLAVCWSSNALADTQPARHRSPHGSCGGATPCAISSSPNSVATRGLPDSFAGFVIGVVVRLRGSTRTPHPPHLPRPVHDPVARLARVGRDPQPKTRGSGDERQLTEVRGRSLMTESELRRLRPFCRLGVVPAADRRWRARGSRRRQSRSAGSHSETQSVGSRAIQSRAFRSQNGCSASMKTLKTHQRTMLVAAQRLDAAIGHELRLLTPWIESTAEIRQHFLCMGENAVIGCST